MNPAGTYPLNRLRVVGKRGTAVLEALTKGLSLEDPHRKVDVGTGVFLPVHVDFLGGGLFRVAHYVDQNGDQCPDPEMVFLHREGRWYPVDTRLLIGTHYEELELVGEDTATVSKTYGGAVTFANIWMKNIRHQQRLL